MSDKKLDAEITEKIREATEKGQDLVQMYQAGYLDGSNDTGKLTSKCFKTDFKNAKFKAMCMRAFELRFVKRLQGKIKAREWGAEEQKLRVKMVRDFDKKGAYDKKDVKRLGELKYGKL